MLNRITLVIASAALIMSTLAVIPRASAAVPDSLRPLGVTRYAFAAGTGTIDTASSTYVPVTGLTQSIVIPSGKRGDVFVFFCAFGQVGSAPSTLSVRAMQGGSVMGGGLLETYSVPEGETRCANFYKLNVGAGTKNVHMEYSLVSGIGPVYLSSRHMIVVVNIHD